MPRLLINRDPVGPFVWGRRPQDVLQLGEVMGGVQALVEALGWTRELQALMAAGVEQVSRSACIRDAERRFSPHIQTPPSKWKYKHTIITRLLREVLHFQCSVFLSEEKCQPIADEEVLLWSSSFSLKLHSWRLLFRMKNEEFPPSKPNAGPAPLLCCPALNDQKHAESHRRRESDTQHRKICRVQRGMQKCEPSQHFSCSKSEVCVNKRQQRNTSLSSFHLVQRRLFN